MDFQGMKRKKLQTLCKKHGIPANLKNIEMASRLASLFQDQTSPVSSQTTRCSVIESQRDGASVDDEPLVLNKTDETLVTSEYNTVEEEMEISKEGPCVMMPTEMGLLSANRHGDLSESNTNESSSAEEQADICKVGHCETETLDEVKDDSQKKSEGTVSSEVKNAASSVLDESAVSTATPERNLAMMEQLSHNGAESVNHQSEEVLFLSDSGLDEEGKQVEHKATESPEESDVLNTSQNEGVSDLHDESNSVASLLMQSYVGGFNGDGVEWMEDNKSGGNKPMEFYEEESVVFTGINSAGKSATLHSQLLHELSGDKKAVRTAEEVASEFPGEPEQEDAAKSEENKALEFQVYCDHFIRANTKANSHDDMSDVVSASEGQSIMGDFEPHTDGKQEREEVEFKDESALFTWFDTCLLLGESTQDRPGADSQAENVPGLDATQGTSEKSRRGNSPHVDSVNDIDGEHTIMECNPEPEIFVATSPSPSLVQVALSFLPAGPILVKETVSTLAAEEDIKASEETLLKEQRLVAELAEAEEVQENSAVHLKLSTNNAASSSILGESAVFTTPERNLMMMEQLSQNEKKLTSDSVNQHSFQAVESPAVVFTTPEQVLLLGDSVQDEVRKQVDCDNITGGNITAKSHAMSDSDVLAASESQSIMGDFEPFTAKIQEREEVEFKDESALFTRIESCLLLGESAHGNNKSGSSHHDYSAKVILKGDNTVADSSGNSTTSGVFYSHEFNVGEETARADFASKGSQAEYVDSTNLFDLDIEGADTIMDAEVNASFSSPVLDGTCSLVSEESSRLTCIHDQINDALEDLAITDELKEAKVTAQRDDKGSLMLDSSAGSRRMST